jgi:hypothetical protein
MEQVQSRDPQSRTRHRQIQVFFRCLKMQGNGLRPNLCVPGQMDSPMYDRRMDLHERVVCNVFSDADR